MKKNNGKPSKVKDFMRNKIFIVIIIVLILMGVLIGRLIYINNEKGETYAKRVLSQQITYVNTSLPYQRGTIYDRNGIALARSVKVYNVILDPKVVLTFDYYVEPTIEALVDVFGFERSEIEKILEEKPNSSYVVLRKQETFERVNAFNERVEEDHKEQRYVKGVWFEEEYRREYPAGSLASHVIGFTNKGNAGAYGIEQFYND
ncbi:MAG: peptidoglycan glycosyltransferase, partial [Lachnospiraceae bacterium]|nr:peptidoglycan glycosyltransferase [Lachnospiraceae bacterium]